MTYATGIHQRVAACIDKWQVTRASFLNTRQVLIVYVYFGIVVDVSLKDTLDKMEGQLKKHCIHQSTLTSCRYGSVSSPDSGLTTRPSDYTFNYEGNSRVQGHISDT